MRLKPVDPETFLYAFNLASAAMDQRLPAGTIPTIAGKSLDVEVERGKVERITFEDGAPVRLLDAVASVFHDPSERVAVAMRIYHLYAMLSRGEATPWMRELAAGPMLHPAVLAVAATYPIDGDQGYNKGFFTEVQQVAGTMEVAEPCA